MALPLFMGDYMRQSFDKRNQALEELRRKGKDIGVKNPWAH
jgi:hypothetical protein